MHKKIFKRAAKLSLRRWAAYAAAGAATALAAHNDTEAAGTIYYSGTLNVTINPGHGFSMALLSHGRTEIGFPTLTQIAEFSVAGTADDRLTRINGLIHSSQGINPHFAGAKNGHYLSLSNLAAGVKASGQHFTSGPGGAVPMYLASHQSPPEGSQFRNAGVGFLAFEFKNPGSSEQYGWARVDMTSSGTSFTVVDYAIGSPGLAISIGQTTIAPAWTGAVDSAWANAANWTGGVAPGSTSSTTDTDTALFNQAIANQPAVIDANRNLMNITFDTANCPAIVIGATTGNPLLLTQGGSIQLTATVVQPQTINAPLVLEGVAGAQTNTYTLANNSTTAAATLTVAGVISSGATQGGATLVLSGTNTGANTLSGSITDGGAGSQLGLSVLGGNWILSGADSFSGGTTIAGGATLNLSGSAPSFNSTGMNIVSAGSLVVNSSQQIGTITGSGNVAVNSGRLTAYEIRQNSLAIGAGATVTLVASGSGSVGDPLGPNNTNFSSNVTSLTIAGGMNHWTGTLDIGNNGLVIAYGAPANDPFATIENLVESGYNGGNWSGTGITSTIAAASTNGAHSLNIGLEDFTPGVGAFANETSIVFEGQTITTNAILVRLTYMDDLVLAGDMSQDDATDDALLFAANYGVGTTWSVGDITHDGSINSNDALLFAANYFVSDSSSLDGASGADAMLGGAAAVPEPATLGLLALGAAGLLAIRRRRGRAARRAVESLQTIELLASDWDGEPVYSLTPDRR